ncbi:uncharacterized protein [Choristoneura fumiferana]|uniref:uncharacterized protein n=1 Tax=Choristoneura fumiferana TaxID=7141 RepID=UPI003D156BA0
MGMIQSIFCTLTFCMERVLTWTCCAFLLMLLMFTILILMVYGISVGYHYAQKELASFAMVSRSTPSPNKRRSGGDGPDEMESKPVVRLVAVNRSAVDHPPKPILEVYRNRNQEEKIFLEQKQTPIVVLETERPPAQPTLMPHEKKLAEQLIGRFRRSKNITTVEPFLRPIKDFLAFPVITG